MISVKKISAQSGNAYILFGYEAIQARPNLDPYTSTLRINNETMQVETSDVHIKHHVRRGIKSYAAANSIGTPEATIFYEKEDQAGKSRNFATRLKQIREAYKITNEDKKGALNHCLDLPLFGYVQAVEKDKYNVTNAINTLFRPSTFHSCEIFSLGRNNAFPGEKDGRVNEASGSASVDSLEYGFILSLWELNLNMLRINAEHHKLIDWNKSGASGWMELFVNGLWRAYTSDRYPSFTQRSQFAQFIVGWLPEGNVSYENPADLFNKLDKKKITSHCDAITELNKILPEFLKNWDCNQKTQYLTHNASNCQIKF